MKLIGLHIENFGGLHDHTEAFDAGLSVRLQPNGWGKSTLAVFIKAMLYGLPVTTRRSLIENERKRYTPWQGGVFGGSLDIEVGGEAYRIERSFGAKESEDTLSVVSLRTGAEADVDWASAPGEMLLGVDAAAYERSTYLSQRPDDMTKDGTVSIHTKLNRLVDATDDLANYDSAMEALEKKRRELRHLTGGGGAIAACQERMAYLARETERCYAQRAALQDCRARMGALTENITTAKAEAKTVQQAISQELKQREGRAVGDRLTALQAEEAELSATLSDCRDALGGQEPTEHMIEALSNAVAARDAARRLLNEKVMNDGEVAETDMLIQRFGTGLPTEEQLDALREAARDYNRASVLAMDYENGQADVENSTPEERYRQARADLAALQTQRRAMEQGSVNNTSKKFNLLPAVMLALAVVLAIAALWVNPLWIAALVCFGVALIFAAIAAKRRATLAAQAEQNKRQASHLDEAIRQAELYLQAAEQALRFTKLWRRAYADEPCPGASEAALSIERLATLGARLESLLEKKKQTEMERRACRHALDEAQAHLLTLMRHMKGAPEDTSLLVRWMTEIYSRYREALSRRERKQAEIAALRKQYQNSDPLPTEQAQSSSDVAALEERQRELARHLAEWSEALAREEQTEARLTSETEELDELESEQEMLSAELERMTEQLAAIQSAQKYLKLAREQLSGRYLNAMQDSFGRYLRVLTGDDAPVFTMDAQFRVKLRAAGLGRDTDAFSVGMRDLIALCERLALLDAMFEGERPFLILDDPFTNLDDATVDRACALVQAVAARYQVLYLTCHSSRLIGELTMKEDETI